MSARVISLEKAEGRDSFYIRLDDGSALKASGDVIVKAGVYVGMELDGRALTELNGEIELQKVKERAAAIIGSRPLSERELAKRLVERGASAENAERAVLWLRGIGAVDDAAYAAELVRYYANRGFGRAKIKDEFYRRGIPRELWDEALSSFSAQDETIDRFVASKLRGAEPDRKTLKKVSDALFRRGFSWDEIRGALARYEFDE